MATGKRVARPAEVAARAWVAEHGWPSMDGRACSATNALRIVRAKLMAEFAEELC